MATKVKRSLIGHILYGIVSLLGMLRIPAGMIVAFFAILVSLVVWIFWYRASAWIRETGYDLSDRIQGLRPRDEESETWKYLTMDLRKGPSQEWIDGYNAGRESLGGHPITNQRELQEQWAATP